MRGTERGRGGLRPSDFERFDDAARRATVLSELYARQHGSPCTTTDHIALALHTPPVSDRLAGLQTFAELDSALEELGVVAPTPSPDGRIPFDPEARATLERAFAVADASGDRSIGPEHLLVAVLRSRSNAAAALGGLGLDPARAPAEWRATNAST